MVNRQNVIVFFADFLQFEAEVVFALLDYALDFFGLFKLQTKSFTLQAIVVVLYSLPEFTLLTLESFDLSLEADFGLTRDLDNVFLTVRDLV